MAVEKMNIKNKAKTDDYEVIKEAIAELQEQEKKRDKNFKPKNDFTKNLVQ